MARLLLVIACEVCGIYRLRQWISQSIAYYCIALKRKEKSRCTLTQHDPFCNVAAGPGKVVAETLISHTDRRSNKSYWYYHVYYPHGVTLCCLHRPVRPHRATTPLLSYAFQAQSPIDVIEFFIASCRELDSVISRWLELALPQIQISDGRKNV